MEVWIIDTLCSGHPKSCNMLGTGSVEFSPKQDFLIEERKNSSAVSHNEMCPHNLYQCGTLL